MTRASSILFWFSLIFLVSLGLYQTSYKVDQLSRQLTALNARIDLERRNIHVLKAEWVYLSNPARIEAAARKHLTLVPTKPGQIARADKLAAVLPAMHETTGNVTVAAMPIAGLRTAAATHTPKSAAGEEGRLNTHLVMGKAAAAVHSRYQMAGDESYGLADVGLRQ